ncbi:MAG: hypothetical protein PHU65_05800 [Actinomycetota bacterium]|jgi:esterase/lipase|nr:hypothetical protein [Actinomycetota bacterium]
MKLFDYEEDNDSGYFLSEKKDAQYRSNLDNECNDPACKNHKSNRMKKFSVSFESPFLSGFSENDTVYGEYLDSAIQKNRKCIILLHGFKSVKKGLSPYYYFAEQAIKNGYSCFFMHLPFHLERTPFSRKSGEILLDNDDRGMLDFFHQVVVDIKKSIDILKKEFPIENFFVCGLSLGGMCSVFIKAFEKRIKKAVLVECGGNWHEIYWNSFMSKIILKGRYLRESRIEKEESDKFYRQFPEFIYNFKELYINRNENFFDLKEIQNSDLNKYINPRWFLSDPLTWGHRINKDESLMICSRFDPLFNKTTVFQLKKELDNPKLIWINKLHTSNVFKDRKLNSIIFDYLNKEKD